MSRKGKRTAHMKLMNVKGDPQGYHKLFAEAEKHAILGKYQIAAGVFQHPRTGMWQVWSSTEGPDISWLAAYREEERAEAAVESWRQFCQTPAVYDEQAVEAFLAQLIKSSDAEPENVSGADVANITKRIREAVFDTYKPR
jgi:hypothetical protein